MKAIICPKYGPPSVVELRDVDDPTPKESDVLIKVHAASVNATDFEVVRGNLFTKLGTRKPHAMGCDLAGEVIGVGSEVTEYEIGDNVYTNLSGRGYGAFAELAIVPEKSVRLMPESMNYEQASTIPEAAVLALQGMRNYRDVAPGDKVLVNGGGGGVGTFAIQIAKYFGAEVTAVDNNKKLEMMKSIGADHVIDYEQEDFTKSNIKYDRILDVVGRRWIRAYRKSLTSNGIAFIVGATTGKIFQALIWGSLISKLSSKKSGVLIGYPNKRGDMEFINQLFENGDLEPIIDKTFPLEQTAEALQYVEDGNALGKVIIKMQE